jgi:hypothetical protein
MANQPVLGVVEVREQFLYSGERVENVYHVAHSSIDPWNLVDMEDLASAFADWEDATASTHRPTSVQAVNIVVSDLTSLNALRLNRPLTPVINGALLQDSLPNNATIAVKLDTHDRGRGRNGRIFWIGLGEGQVAENELLPAARDDILSSMEALRTAIQTLNAAYHLVVVHRVIHGVRPAQADYSQVYSFSMADLVIDSQKNRLPFHRRHKKRTTPTP